MRGFPKPEVNWTKDGKLLDTRNMLTINRVTYGDAGQYKCSAKNSEGKKEAAFHITVTGNCWPTFVSFSFYSHFLIFFSYFTFFELYFWILCPGPPEINTELKNHSVTYNSSLRFICSLGGFPNLRYSGLKMGWISVTKSCLQALIFTAGESWGEKDSCTKIVNDG